MRISESENASRLVGQRLVTKKFAAFLLLIGMATGCSSGGHQHQVSDHNHASRSPQGASGTPKAGAQATVDAGQHSAEQIHDEAEFIIGEYVKKFGEGKRSLCYPSSGNVFGPDCAAAAERIGGVSTRLGNYIAGRSGYAALRTATAKAVETSRDYAKLRCGQPVTDAKTHAHCLQDAATIAQSPDDIRAASILALSGR